MVVEYLLRIARVGSSWVLYLLLALSVVSLGVIVERWLYFRRLRDKRTGLRERVAAALRRGDLSDAETMLGASRTVEARIVKQSLGWKKGGPRAVSDALASELTEARTELERGLNFLGTLGNNAPFIGLFGTVLGVIEAFHQLSAGANKAAMGNVMSGIAEALVATGVGLFVALPAVIAYNIAQKRIGVIEDAANSLGKLVTAYLETSPPAADAETKPGATNAPTPQVISVSEASTPARSHDDSSTPLARASDAVLAVAVATGGE